MEARSICPTWRRSCVPCLSRFTCASRITPTTRITSPTGVRSMGYVAVVAADQVFKDAAFQFVPGRAVAPIDLAPVGDVILVVGVILDAHVERLKQGTHDLLHVGQIERAAIKSQRADQVYLHQGPQRVR